MLVAVTYEGGQIGQHFGHTQFFKVYFIENGEITRSGVIDTMGEGHCALAGFLTGVGCDALICGGIGPGAINALSSQGITVYAGCAGDPDEAVAAMMSGMLEAGTQPNCDHHHEEHSCSGSGHNCGSSGHMCH